jgi:hypothetical protein
MTKRQYENIIREDFYRLLGFPLIILVSLYIIAIILQMFLKMNYDYFPILFTGIGGVPFLIFYYKREIQKYLR